MKEIVNEFILLCRINVFWQISAVEPAPGTRRKGTCTHLYMSESYIRSMTHAGASYGDILMPTALKCQRMDGSRAALWPEEAFHWARQEVLTWFQSPANRKRPAGFLSAPSVNYTTRYHGRIKAPGSECAWSCSQESLVEIYLYLRVDGRGKAAGKNEIFTTWFTKSNNFWDVKCVK